MMEFSIKQREFRVLGEGIHVVPNPDWEVKKLLKETAPSLAPEVTGSCHSGHQQRAFSYRQMSKIPAARRRLPRSENPKFSHVGGWHNSDV